MNKITRCDLFAFCILVVIGGVFGLVAVPGVMWDRWYPTCVIYVYLMNENGKPIEGACVSGVHRAGDSSASYGYPINNYTSNSCPVSDTNGILVCYSNLDRVRDSGGFMNPIFNHNNRLRDYTIVISKRGYSDTVLSYVQVVGQRKNKSTYITTNITLNSAIGLYLKECSISLPIVQTNLVLKTFWSDQDK